MRTSRFRISRLAASLLVALVALAVFAPAPPARAATSALDFRNAMRKLWEDHITWTRLYIISVAGNLPDQQLTAQRLLDNQTDIGNAIKPFYGEDAGNKLTALLKDHILGAADILAAAKAGDKAKEDAASAKWYSNANDIATFLSTANPKNWPLPAMQSEMKMHLDLTLQEAVDRLGGKYAADIQDYDKVHEEILGMADELSTGIIAQFPDRFDQSSSGQFQSQAAMRKLWEDHVTWTRLYIVSVAAGLPDANLTAQRLLQNQTDIGNALKPAFGEAAGAKVTALLRDHILGAADILAASKAGDKAKADAATTKWYANAGEIAAALNGLDPKAFPLDALKEMMKMHLDLTLKEAVDRLQGKFADDIKDYDQVHTEILGMADALSAGAAAHSSAAGSAPATMPTTGGMDSWPNLALWLATALALLAAGGALAWLADRPSRQ